jgi:hypothetical protein
VSVEVSPLFPNLQQTGQRQEHHVLRYNHLQIENSDVLLGESVSELSDYLRQS